MSGQSAERRLAAILAADVVGYSRLMEANEEATLAALKAHRREVLDPAVAGHGGRVFKTMGDGFLIEFGSVVGAMRCAMDMQRAMPERNAGLPEDRHIRLRIGIHLGDVLVEAGDVFGDGVNIAARLEALASPGGVVVSHAVKEQVGSRVGVVFSDLGEKALKNISQSVRVYEVRAQSPTEGVPGDREPAPSSSPLPVPGKPSIAVLPFANLSGDAEQEYLADGIVEDIITALSRFNGLFVIARNSTFVYKGRAVDVRTVGRELGVRYVLEGSVRRGGDRLRITGQLVEAETGAHLWADRFDGGLADVFDLQDQVTASVVGAIAPTIEKAEIERNRYKPTSNLDAYDYYLRGVAGLHLWTRAGNAEALANFSRATGLDPGFAAAYGNATRCFIQRKAAGWAGDDAADFAEVTRLAALAFRLGKDDAIALCTAGFATTYILGDFDTGIEMSERALTLNPNLASGWMFGGWCRIWNGDLEIGASQMGRAMQLSPQDTQSFAMRTGIAAAHLFAGRYAEAGEWARAAIREQPGFLISHSIAIAAAALSGQVEEARAAAGRLSDFVPVATISALRRQMPIRRTEHREILLKGLSLAGLPD
ncbi:MAG: adenylate/guanylate cyclase domain-containing protein [Paracoccaceae bacterium]